MRWKIAVLMSLMLSPILFVHANEWKYSNPFTGFDNILIINEETNKIKIYDHRFLNYDDCSHKKYVCLKSKVFNFSVPKKIRLTEDSWKLNDYNYTSKYFEKYTMLGKAFENIYLIKSSDNEGESTYIYSKLNGLIGVLSIVKSKSGDDIGVIFSNSNCGFGSSPDCK